MASITPEQIDELLPQTQCGLCGYGGCMPYAEAIIYEKAAINLCPPGGVKTLCALGELLNQEVTPYLQEMEQKAKPKMVAHIREAECIGCVKCIKACPVDAILGSAKQMHTVITDECTGCELCVAPCPVDCIEMLTMPDDKDLTQQKEKANHARKRFQARNLRLSNKPIENKIILKQDYIKAALERAKAKKS